MKKTIIIAILLISLSSCAQAIKSLATATSNDYANGNYIKDTTGLYNPFIGTWQWTNGVNTLTIKFIKKENWMLPTNSKYSEDLLLGGYKFVENNITIANCLTYTTNNVFSDDFAKISGSMYCCDYDFTIIQINMYDITKHKSLQGNFKLLYNPSAPQDVEFVPTAKLTLQARENWFPDVANPPLPGESFPYNVTLTKIE